MATPTLGDVVVCVPVLGVGGVVAACAMLDGADAHLSQYKWRLSPYGYAVRTVYRSGKRYPSNQPMHRDVLGLRGGDKRQADHINGSKLDNRRLKLRIVTHAVNMQNRHQQRNNTSGFRGVTWDASEGGWKAKVQHGGVVFNLGRFATAEAAGAAAATKRDQLGFLKSERV